MSSLGKNRAATARLGLIALFAGPASFALAWPIFAANILARPVRKIPGSLIVVGARPWATAQAASTDALPGYDRDRCDCQVADHSGIVGADGNSMSVGLVVSTPDVAPQDADPGGRPLVIPPDDAADRCAS